MVSKTYPVSVSLRGQGGSEVDFHFFVLSDIGEWQLPGTFFGMKKYCSSPKLLNFQIVKIHTITLSSMKDLIELIKMLKTASKNISPNSSLKIAITYRVERYIHLDSIPARNLKFGLYLPYM